MMSVVPTDPGIFVIIIGRAIGELLHLEDENIKNHRNFGNTVRSLRNKNLKIVRIDILCNSELQARLC